MNEAAAELETDSGNLSRILREEDGRKPGRSLATRIFERFGVSTSLWDQTVPTDEHTDTKHPQEPAA